MTDPFATLLQPPKAPKAWPAERIKAHRIERPEDAEPVPPLPAVASIARYEATEERIAKSGNPWGLPQSEAEVLDDLSRGLSNKGIAAIRGASVKTVDCQISRAKARMKAETTAHAVVMWDRWKRGQQ